MTSGEDMDDILGFIRSQGMEIAIAAVAVLFFLWIIRRTTALKGQQLCLPPGPKGWPLLGALPYVGEFPHRSFFELSKKHGPIMFLQMGSMPTVVVSNAEMAKEVLQTNDQNFASRPSMVVPSILFYGNRDIAFAPLGPHWRQFRKVVNLQLLTHKKLAHFMKTTIKDEILSTVHTILERSQDNKIVNVSIVFAGMTTNNITQMMWNKRHRNVKGGETRRDAKLDEIIKSAMTLLGSNVLADFLPLAFKSIAFKLSGVHKKVKDVRDAFAEFCESIIREKEEALSKEGKLNASAPADEDDFVSVLLKIKNDSGSDLDRGAILAILIDMIIGGTDTTSVTLDWTFTELMKRPDIMKKLLDELSAVVGEDRLVRESDVPNLKYLDAVVKEILRLHSATPLGVPHMSTAHCKIAGYDIPAKTTVFLNVFAIQHDETVWEKPFEFNPDRFLHSDVDYRGRYYNFLPFGAGRRMCPGMPEASSVLHLGLAQFLHTITWSLPEGQTPETLDTSEATGLVLRRATPMLLKVKPRLAHHVIYPTGTKA